MNGAGGSEGGIGRFFTGFTMMIAGGYLFLNSVDVSTHLTFSRGYGRAFASPAAFGTSGYVFIPFIFGIGMVFYNAKNPVGWLLSLSSLVFLLFGVIAATQLRMRHMSAFQLITILVLLMGGLGLFLSSLRNMSRE
ncbi:MAG: hypothetical protein ACQEQV_05960 [Fibrobacterota bacterium]